MSVNLKQSKFNLKESEFNLKEQRMYKLNRKKMSNSLKRILNIED